MIKTLIFDFDGVIGDTFDLSFKICRTIFKGLSEQDFRDYHNGNVFRSNIIRWEPHKLKLFYSNQKQGFTKKNLFPLKDVLRKLQDKYQLLVISSTTDENVKDFLNLGGFDQFFLEIFGATTHKSKVEKFKMIFKKYKLKPHECLFITDTIGDIKEARKVNIKSIAVTWGYHSKELLSKQNPLAIIEKPNELLKRL